MRLLEIVRKTKNRIKIGDRVRHTTSNWVGTVSNVLMHSSGPQCVVKWDTNGTTGRVNQAHLEKVQ